jgi:hypothetical protein
MYGRFGRLTFSSPPFLAHIDSHLGLRCQRESLDPIPGVGAATAAALLAKVPEIKQYRSFIQGDFYHCHISPLDSAR